MNGVSPKEIAMRRERAVVSRLINDIDRLVYGVNFLNGERFGLTRDLQAVIRAVFLGQIEGRPFGLAKLADYLGMPRATLERKLSYLEQQGQIVRSGRWFILPVSKLNDPRMLKLVEQLVLMIHKASKELAKMPKMGT